jgi:hypothetical protein
MAAEAREDEQCGFAISSGNMALKERRSQNYVFFEAPAPSAPASLA